MSARYNEEYPFKLLAAHILHHAMWEQQRHPNTKLEFWGSQAFRDLCDYTGVEAEMVRNRAVRRERTDLSPEPAISGIPAI